MLWNKAPIMCKSKMQKTTALSMEEAEYYAASPAGSEVLYLRKLLERMGFRPSVATCQSQIQAEEAHPDV
jgi:hypothetical protein